MNDALLVCADKGFRLWQADHFALRGRLYLLQFQQPPAGCEPAGGLNLNLLEKAGDDANRALKTAEDTGHIWAKVEALKLLKSYHQTRAQLPEFNREKENEAGQRYAKEAALIEKGLFLTERQMTDLKAQAKKEFEKQTKGWE